MHNGRSGGLGRPAVAATGLALVSAAALAWGGSWAQAGDTGVRPAAVAGDITTVAGGVGGPGAGTEVSLGLGQNALCGISYGAGALYVADSEVVREVSPQTGGLTTPVGTGAAGPLGDGGPAASAALDTCGATLDHSGNLVIADWGDSRIRVVAASTGTFYGQAMTAGDIYTVAGDGAFGYAGDGRLATAAKLDGPQAVAVDGAGNLVISDSGNDRVRVVAGPHRHLLRAGDDRPGTSTPWPATAPTGSPATAARPPRPSSTARTRRGGGRRGEPGHRRQWQQPGPGGRGHHRHLLRAGDDRRGHLHGGRQRHRRVLRRWRPGHRRRTRHPPGRDGGRRGQPGHRRPRQQPGPGGRGQHRHLLRAGDDRRGHLHGGRHRHASGSPATAARPSAPSWPARTSVAVDGAGNLVIADGANGRVRVVAASTGTFYGQAMTAGDIYTVAGNGTGAFSGDGGLATGAELNGPRRVAVDGAGNLVITDRGNDRVRVVAATHRHLLRAGDDRRAHLHRRRRRHVRVLRRRRPGHRGRAGQPRTGVAVDGAGNLVIADTGNNRIRVVAASTGTFYGQAMTAGDIYTVAGNGSAGLRGRWRPGHSRPGSTPAGRGGGRRGQPGDRRRRQ